MKLKTLVRSFATAAVLGFALNAQAKYGYVTDGLIAHFDGYDNVGTGYHNANATYWTNLLNGADIKLSGSSWDSSCRLRVGSSSAGGSIANSEYLNWKEGDTDRTIEIVLKYDSSCVSGVAFMGTADSKIAIGRYNSQSWIVSSVSASTVKNVIGDNFGTFSIGYSSGVMSSEHVFSDGVADTIETGKNSWSGANTKIYVGTRGSGSGMIGYIYSIRIYNRLLSASEAKQNADADAQRFTTARAYTWINQDTDAVKYWVDVANWEDAEGETPALAPMTDANADVTMSKLVTPSLATSQTMLWDLGAKSGKNAMADLKYYLNSVYEGDKYSRRSIRFQTRDYSRCWTVSAILQLVNPNGFYGDWKADSGSIMYDLVATAEHTPIMHNISANRLTKVKVDSNNAKVGTITTYGVLKKMGAGGLEVGATQGTNVILHLTEGSLTLDGRDATVGNDEPPVKGAWLWLDANNTDTYTYGAERSDGRVCVEKWSDPRGAAYPYAYFNRQWNSGGASHLTSLEESNPPYLNTELVAGKTVLDFGRVYNDANESHGLSNCWLHISQRSDKVREAFFVSRKSWVSAASSVIGDYGDQYPFHPAGSCIAGSHPPCSGVRNGDILLDGNRAGGGTAVFSDSKFTVVSVGITNNVVISAIGTDRMYKESGRTGGWKIGEILLFTNELTHVERMRIHKYLQHKWTEPNSVNNEQPFAEALTVHTTATGVKVPEGKSAYIPEVAVASGTLVKQGAGRLKIGEISTTKVAEGLASVEVQEGSVAFGGLDAVSDDDGPAANPMMWLKAEAQYMSISNATDGSGRQYVTEWRDCRSEQTKYKMSLPIGEADFNGTVVPYLVNNAVGNLSSVDLGEWGGVSKGTYMVCDAIDYSVCEAYQASAAKSEAAGAQPFASTDGGVELCNDNFSSGTLIGDTSSYSGSIGRSAVWSLNGTIVDPLASQALRKVNEYNVISLSMDGKMWMSRIGNKQRSVKEGTYSWGGVRIGEWIIYDRRLTAEERRKTNAYLTKKWKGYSSPASERKVGDVKFADGVPAVLDTESDYQIGTFKTAANNVVKQGAGTLDIGGGLALGNESALDVKEGTLNLKMTVGQSPVLDFDAQNLASMTTENWTPEDYEGQPTADKEMRTNVLFWADSAATGNYASYAMASNAIPTYFKRAPVLQYVTVRPGVVKPTVSFGCISGSWTGTYGGYTYGGALDGSGMFFNSSVKAGEIYTIFGDNMTPNRRRAAIVSVRSGTDLYTRGQCGWQKDTQLGTILSKNTYTSDIVNGYSATNGVQLASVQDTVAPDGVNLYTFAPLTAQPVDAFASTSSGGVGGGCRIGEQIGFATALSTTERANFTKYMMKKWFDEDYTLSLASINVENGATLNFTGDYLPSSIAVGSITGGGTITGIDAISGVSAINTSGTDDGEWTKTTVDSAVTFADAVMVTASAKSGVRPKVGSYTIFSATSLDNVDLTKWTLIQPLASQYQDYRIVTLTASGNAIKLNVRPNGFMVMAK